MTIIFCDDCGDEIKRLKFGSARLAGVCARCKQKLKWEIANARDQLRTWMQYG